MSSSDIPMMCAAVGAAVAVGAMVRNGRGGLLQRDAPTACSARRASAAPPAAPDLPPATSARFAVTSSSGGDSAFEDPDLWGLSPEGEKQFASSTLPRGGEMSQAVQNAKRELQPQQVEYLGGRGRGTDILIPGRAAAEPAKRKVTGCNLFYVTEQYADAMDEVGIADQFTSKE